MKEAKTRSFEQRKRNRRAGWRGLLAAILGGAGAAHAAPAAAPTPPAQPPAARQPSARASAPVAEAPAASAPAASASATAAGLPADGALARTPMVIYKSGETRLKLHFARPSPDRFPGPRPCVVFFHGGGWRSGDPKQFMGYAERLAQVGVIGISAQYRFLADDEMLPMRAVQDARSALRYVRGKAAALGCDVQRIGAGGGSSGGHLAAMTAVSSAAGAKPGLLDDPTDNMSVSPRPQALFLLNAPLDLEKFDRPVPLEKRRLISPAQLMDASFPPTWIFHGTADKVVPFSQVTDFRDRAKALGAGEVTIQAFQGKGHGFFNAKRGDGEDFETTVQGIIAALKKLGWAS